jgi:LuxR family maltose regulon positive regulatory protein
LLDQAQALNRPGSYPDVRPIPAIRARLHIAAGDLDAAEDWAHDHRVTPTDDPTFLREYDHLTLVRLLLARHHRDLDAGHPRAGDPAPLGDAAALLDRLHATAHPARAGSLLEIGILRALVRHAAGHRGEALAELNGALAQAPEPDGYVRLFLDEGAPMLALLHQSAAPDPGDDTGDDGVLRRHARRLLDAADLAQGPGRAPLVAVPPADQGPLTDPLSDRELEVLRLLDSDLTGPEVARRLFVSVNTLRTHTKRIFTKLEVNNRTAAVRRGHQLGLL